MDNVIKIDLRHNNAEIVTKWDAFVEKCLTSCINKNISNNKYKILFRYDYDTVEMVTAKEVDGVLEEIKSISLDKSEYETASNSDKDIIEKLLNTIKCSPD